MCLTCCFFFNFSQLVRVMRKKLHIVSFNVSYPPDYGGAIDAYFKLETLSQTGIDIILHCFEYNRPRQAELEKICSAVYYYPRKTGFKSQFSLSPYIVKSRSHPDLLQNLLAVQAPILFEGLHSCSLLTHPLLFAYKKLVRTHNIEHEYYLNLWRSENDNLRQLYLLTESIKLRLFERKLKSANNLLTISTIENKYFQEQYGNAVFVPAFHPFSRVKSVIGMGDYLLYHGDLSISENEKAVRYLLQRIFSQITVSFVIAGKNPPDSLKKLARDIPHVNLLPNPTTEQMNELIENAQICIIPSFQLAGMKLKLLASLFGGRHCLTNSTMLEGTDLKNLCHIADTPREMIEAIEQLMNTPFGPDEISKRKQVLETLYSNESSSRKIIELL